VHFTDVRRFWLLHTLNGAIPVLSHFLENESTPPEPVYLALAKLVGELSTFSPDAESVTIPRFDFLRLGDVFEPLFARTLGLLTVDSVPAYVEIPLTKRSDGMFVGRFPEPRVANHEFFVAVRSTVPEAETRDRIPQLLKIADWGKIVEVVKQARHGVRAEVEWTPSNILPLRPGLTFFRLRREGAFWDDVAKTSTIALCLPNDPVWKDVNLQVYAVDPAHLR
jgi:type VI secretion system protein ImpJ